MQPARSTLRPPADPNEVMRRPSAVLLGRPAAAQAIDFGSTAQRYIHGVLAVSPHKKYIYIYI